MAKEDMRRTCPTCGAKALLVWLDGQWVRLRDAAARVGLAHQAVYSRLRRGVPLKDALRPDWVGNAPRVYTYRGEAHTLPEWARRSGIPYQTLYGAIKRGATLAGVLENPPSRCGVKYELDGVEKTVPQWAEEYGLGETTVRRRMAQGLSLREALTQPVRGRPAPQRPVKTKINPARMKWR